MLDVSFLRDWPTASSHIATLIAAASSIKKSVGYGCVFNEVARRIIVIVGQNSNSILSRPIRYLRPIVTLFEQYRRASSLVVHNVLGQLFC